MVSLFYFSEVEQKKFYRKIEFQDGFMAVCSRRKNMTDLFWRKALRMYGTVISIKQYIEKSDMEKALQL